MLCDVAAPQVAKVVGIDNIRNAIDDAETNAQLNGVTNTTFVCGPAEKTISTVLEVRQQGGGGGH